MPFGGLARDWLSLWDTLAVRREVSLPSRHVDECRRALIQGLIKCQHTAMQVYQTFFAATDKALAA